MASRRDLFDDDEPDSSPPREAQAPAAASSEASQAPPGGPAPGGGDTGEGGLSRRQFLRVGGAAAVAGAVVGAGAAYGLGALDDDQAVVTTDEGEMTLGAPPGRLLSGAVVHLKVNGADRWVEVDANETLAEVLRRKLGLTGTKIGCDRSECSACTVLVNGQAYNSCSLLAIREDGKEITTIEGLSQNGELSPVQQAFLDQMGLQCGFCTPGQIMQATALLARYPKPTDEQIRREMSGNLCKCSAYANILAAIRQAAGQGSV